MNFQKSHTRFFGYYIFYIVLFFFSLTTQTVYADVTTGLSAVISSSGDVPAIQVPCSASSTNASMYIFRHQITLDNPNAMFGNVIQRVGCVGGVASFTTFNLNQWLVSSVDPIYLGIKDTTGIYGTPPMIINLCGDWDSYRCDRSYNPTDTEWPTLGAGPAFVTLDNGVTWDNLADGDGSANYASSTSLALTGDSNVLFLPGIESSRLYMQTPSKCPLNCEDQLWEPNISVDGVDLYLNSNGISVNPVYTRDIIKTSNISPGGVLDQNIYKSFSDMMDGLVSGGKIAAWQPYAYDWRQGVQDIVDNGTPYQGTTTSLVGTLQKLLASSKSGKVTIVAHSNGGLLAKALLKKLEDDKTAGRNNLIDHIDVVVLVAAPQWGTPTAVPALLHGYDQDINPLHISFLSLLDTATARTLAENMPSAYGLLPSAEYFKYVSYPVVSFVPNAADPYMSKDVTTYTTAISTYVGEKNFILGTDQRSGLVGTDTLKPGVGVSGLLATAESLHSAIDTMTVPATIRVVQIAGWGLDTIAGFQYQANDLCNTILDAGCTGKYLLDEVPVFTADGDKTVVTPSALAMSGEKWWVNLDLYNNDHKKLPQEQHKNILENQSIIDFIQSIVQQATTTSSVYMSTTTPVDTQNRLRLSVHSPVTIGVYDSAGDFTGKLCPTPDTCTVQENIPNSGYYEFGEGKYVTAPQGSVQKVILQGTDTGAFTFDYQTVTPSGSATTASFVDLPVTPQTQATVTVNQATQTPQLALDLTGDGTTDFVVTPNQNFDPVLFLQILKKTVDGFTMDRQTKKNLESRIDTIILLVQKGKVARAKLQASDFAKSLSRKDQNRLKGMDRDDRGLRHHKLTTDEIQTMLTMINQLLDNLN